MIKFRRSHLEPSFLSCTDITHNNKVCKASGDFCAMQKQVVSIDETSTLNAGFVISPVCTLFK